MKNPIQPKGETIANLKAKSISNRVKRPVVGVTTTNQIPLLEHRSFGEARPKWILWLAYNPNRDAGTYLIMNEDGSVWRETTYPDGSVDTCLIKDASYKRGSDHVIT